MLPFFSSDFHLLKIISRYYLPTRFQWIQLWAQAQGSCWQHFFFFLPSLPVCCWESCLALPVICQSKSVLCCCAAHNIPIQVREENRQKKKRYQAAWVLMLPLWEPAITCYSLHSVNHRWWRLYKNEIYQGSVLFLVWMWSCWNECSHCWMRKTIWNLDVCENKIEIHYIMKSTTKKSVFWELTHVTQLSGDLTNL